jgi:hypothetical protein
MPAIAALPALAEKEDVQYTVLPAATDRRPPTDRLEPERNVADASEKEALPDTATFAEVMSIDPVPLAEKTPPTTAEEPLDIEKDPEPD